MQEELLVCTCIGSFINWKTPFADANEINFSLSEILMSLDHQHDGLALKSPVITDENGLVFFMSLKSLSKLLKMNQIQYYFG